MPTHFCRESPCPVCIGNSIVVPMVAVDREKYEASVDAWFANPPSLPPCPVIFECSDVNDGPHYRRCEFSADHEGGHKVGEFVGVPYRKES